MTAPEPDTNEDDDLRRLLQADSVSTSTTHDAAVLQAARSWTQSAQVPRDSTAPAPDPAPASTLAPARRSAPGSTLPPARPTFRRVGRFAVPGWTAAAAVLVSIVIGAVWHEQERRMGAPARYRPVTAQSTTPVTMLVREILIPGLTRSATSLPQISIPVGVDIVQLRLEVSATLDAHGTVLSLNTRSGRQVWQGPPLEIHASAAQGILTAGIPVKALAPGDYELSVRSTVDAASSQPDYYYFKVRYE